MALTRRIVPAGFLGLSHVLMASAGAGTIYVEASAPAGGNGASWATAYAELADALGAAQDGDVLLVAQGNYLPDPARLDRLRSFSPRSGVTVRGGYRGLAGGGNPNDRDPRAFVTVLNGDLNGDDGDDFTNRDDNSVNVVFLRNVERVVIEGLTIRGGRANVDFRRDGGGLNAAFSKFVVRDCVFSENQCEWYGGGIALLNSFAGEIDIINTFFVYNAAGRLGGAVATYTTSPRFINCYIGNNVAASGGGFYVNQNCEITNCTIVHNIVVASGGGVGAGLYNNGGVPVVSNSIIRDNTGTSELRQFWNQGSGVITVRNSTISGLNIYAGNGNVNLPANFANLAGPDGFIGTRDDQPRLPPGSPLIGLGDNALVAPGVATDLFGGPRVVGDSVDIGADEFGCVGDANADGVINFADLNVVLSSFGLTTDQGDLNADGVVNFSDLNLVLSAFGASCGW
ncbi:MAG: hypothetical protein KF684_05735 [Phycisphaeraceae bacterium]|nr:hypothetical protein [Phycisphaeraceae bacterium]